MINRSIDYLQKLKKDTELTTIEKPNRYIMANKSKKEVKEINNQNFKKLTKIIKKYYNETDSDQPGAIIYKNQPIIKKKGA